MTGLGVLSLLVHMISNHRNALLVMLSSRGGLYHAFFYIIHDRNFLRVFFLFFHINDLNFLQDLTGGLAVHLGTAYHVIPPRAESRVQGQARSLPPGATPETQRLSKTLFSENPNLAQPQSPRKPDIPAGTATTGIMACTSHF